MVVPSGATTYYIDRMEITMAKQSENMEYQKAINHIVQMVKDGQLIVGSKIPNVIYPNHLVLEEILQEKL